MATNSAYVVEFQAFYDNANSFIIKELAAVNLSDCTFIHLHLLPPYSKANLNRAKLRSVRWLEHNYHGLKWEGGNVSYSVDSLRKLLNSFNCIYTKGLQKCNFLKELTAPDSSTKIFNLTYTEIIPNLSSVSQTLCPIEMEHCNGCKRCALKNAVYLADWLRSNFTTVALDFHREVDRNKSFFIFPSTIKHKCGLYFDVLAGTICCVWCGRKFETDPGGKNNFHCMHSSTRGMYLQNVPSALDHIVPRRSVGLYDRHISRVTADECDYRSSDG